MKSKPTWSNAFGYSTASAFYVGEGRPAITANMNRENAMYTKLLLKRQASRASQEIEMSMGQKQILLAEGDPRMCKELAGMLREEGHAVTEVCDEHELLARIARLRASMSGGRFFDVDLIVSDVHVLGVSGLDMLTDLRRSDHQTPVIRITAFGDQELRMRASRLKLVTVLDKPFDLDSLRHLVSGLLFSSGIDAGDPYF